MENNNKKKTKQFGLSTLSVRNRTSVLILTILIVLMGVNSYTSMPVESFPEIVIPQFYIGTPYPGNSPADIENLVTRPLEREVKSITGVKKITSTSLQDYSVIVVELNTGIEIDKGLMDIKDAVDKAKSELPTDLPTDPDVFELNFSEFPIMYVNVSGKYGIDELKQYAEYLEDKIEQLTEISKVDIRGIQEKEVKIWADMHKMAAREVTFHDIETALANENMTVSGGNIKAGDFRRSIRVVGEFDQPREMLDVIVKSEKGNIVYLRDVATVEFDFAETQSYARLNSQTVVTLDIVKRSGQNLLDASDKIKKILQDAEKTRFPEGLEVSITNDQSKFTRSMVSNLENSVISGVILVVVTLMFFLGLRNASFVGIAIPLSMFMAFLLLNSMGVTLNMMVLFSLILALGMLVDNGIVVVENIYRLLQEGKKPVAAAIEGVGQVALPIIASTATTVAVFVPLAFWEGLMGEFMKYLPITLIITLSSSLFVGLVINPAIAAYFMKLDKNEEDRTTRGKRKRLILAGILIAIAIPFYIQGALLYGNLIAIIGLFGLLNMYLLNPATRWFQNKLLPWMENKYRGLLAFTLRKYNPIYVFIGTFLLLVFSIMLLGIKSPKVLFFPENEPQYVNVFVQAPIGTDIEKTNAITKAVEKDITKLVKDSGYAGIVESIVVKVGEGANDPNQGPNPGVTPHKGLITLQFVEYEYRTEYSTKKVLEEIRDRIKKFPGVLITAEKNQEGPPVGPPINLEISGEDYNKLIRISKKLKKRIEDENIAGIEELKSDLEDGQPELIVDIDREKARRFGLSSGQIAMELRTALFGKEISKYKLGEDDYDIELRLDDRYRYDLDALMNQKITFMDKFGKMHQVPISAVADVKYTSTYGSIKRKDLDRVITLYSAVSEGYNPNEILSEIKVILDDVDMPEGYKVDITGEQEEQAKSMAFLMRAMMIAVLVVFLIIVTQFNSLLTPIIIVTSVLFSTIGVFLGLIIFNMDFVVIMTGIGIISLAGVVVNNAIVLIDYTNLLRERKREELGLTENERLPMTDIIETIVEGGRTRMRPVLLTAITTVLGLIPLATGFNIDFAGMLSEFKPNIYYGGDNANFWGPMAWTVIFGLTFATFLTLVVVPVMYLLSDKLMIRGGNTANKIKNKLT